ncbi:Hypothetical predicted protein, partial [Paramuricea clavata]
KARFPFGRLIFTQDTKDKINLDYHLYHLLCPQQLRTRGRLYKKIEYEREGVVCPSQLRKGLFTTSAVDNIDHNTSSTTSQTLFHGTAISLVQHPTTNNQGTPRATDTFDPTALTTTKTIAHLPSSYTEIAPMTQPNGDLYAPRVPWHLPPLLTLA